jgi:hypothetical protein
LLERIWLLCQYIYHTLNFQELWFSLKTVLLLHQISHFQILLLGEWAFILCPSCSVSLIHDLLVHCDWWIRSWKRHGRKRVWPTLRYYPGVCLQGLKKTKKNLGQVSWSPGWYLNWGPPKYKRLSSYFISTILSAHYFWFFSVSSRTLSFSLASFCNSFHFNLLPCFLSLKVYEFWPENLNSRVHLGDLGTKNWQC